MTTKIAPDQERCLGVAIWLTHVTPLPRTPAEADGSNLRTAAHLAARGHGAAVLGEFLFSSAAYRPRSNSGWQELHGFLQSTGATVLIAARPETIAAGSGVFCRRARELEAATVRLVFTNAARRMCGSEDARPDRRAA